MSTVNSTPLSSFASSASSRTPPAVFTGHVSDHLVIFSTMDHQTLVVYAVLGVVLSAVLCLYSLIILWSPPPIKTRESERKYRSASSPNTPQDLPSLFSDASLDLTVVIPAYNETTRLPSMLESTIAHLTSPTIKRNKNRTYEILIVDDGSSDDTSGFSLGLAKKYADAAVGKKGDKKGVVGEIRVVTLEKNMGKGGAVRHGMLHGRGRRLLMVDADGASRFEDLESLWDRLDELSGEGYGVAVGSRAHLVKTEAVVKRSLLRNILMYGLHTILRIVGVGHIRDTQCGFKLFTRSAAQQIFPLQHITNWIFDVELLLLAKTLDIPVVEVPVEWHEVAGSKLNVVTDSMQMLRDLLVLRGNHLLGRWKVTKRKGKAD